MKTWILAITGASGAVLGIRVLEELLAKGSKVHVLISSQAFGIIHGETGLDFRGETDADTQKALSRAFKSDNVFFHSEGNLYAPISSGSYKTAGMLVVPCSMKTLAAIAYGFADSIITRAADVCLKEGRSLLLSPREMPFSAVHLENMLRLARLGVKIAPPVPAFYHKPESLEDIVNFVAGKILDAVGVENNLFNRWGGEN